VRVETIGSATLYLGDCLEILPTLGKVDAVITDPPYGLNSWTHTGGHSVSKEQADDLSRWDKERPDIRWIVDLGVPYVVWGGNYFSDQLLPSRAPLIWDKKQRGMHFADGEMALTNHKHGTLRILELSIGASDCFGKKDHPTQKPVAVMEWAIESLKVKPSIVLDPFMGSGTTGVACMNLGRKFIGIEIERKYFDIACERIENAQRQARMFA